MSNDASERCFGQDDPSTSRELRKRVTNIADQVQDDSSGSDEHNSAYETNEDEAVHEDICLVYGEFGKNNELWLQCRISGKWAHDYCSGGSRKSYFCD